ncbi:MAG TPA: S8 family serine peptidase [Mycobacteriales bacterium]|nr:S8 family serine peptidase [Mycobacteriales bacterium]
MATAAPAPSASGPTQHVIVLLKNQHSELPANAGSRVVTTDREQAPLVARARSHGGKDFRQLHVTNAFATAVPASEAAALAADPAVAAVLPDRLVKAPAREDRRPSKAAPGPVSDLVCPSDPSKPLLEPEALQTTHTVEAQRIATGKGVKVAWLADGIDPNNADFIRPDGSHVFVDYQDFSGEGPSAVTSGAEAFGDASSIAAQGRLTYDLADYVNPAHPLPAGCTIRVLGMAPGASLVGLKVFPAGGFAFNSSILEALDYAVTVDHVDVINESFGSNQFPDTGDDPTALFNEQLIRAGVTVVASSGDAGDNNTIGSPATSPGVISVGGSTIFRSYAQTTGNGFQLSNGKYRSNAISALSSSGFSQAGRTIDLLAPGDLGWALCSTNTDVFLDCTDNKGDPSGIQQFGGTSQSAPLTAGAAALVIQAYRDSHHGASPTPDLVRRLLTSTSQDLGLPTSLQGAGLLDSNAAVRAARSIRGGAKKADGELVAGVNQLNLTARSGGVATARVQVTNVGSKPQVVRAAVRSTTRTLSTVSKSVPFDRDSLPTFVDAFGTTRTYTKTTFAVPKGGDHLAASIAWPGEGRFTVRLVLLEPDGTYSGYSLPQGAGSGFAVVDIPQPKAGTWTAVLFSSPGAVGFTGTVRFGATTFQHRTSGVGVPKAQVVPAGATRTVVVGVPAPRKASDTSDALTLTGSGATTVVPITLRTLVPLNRHGGTFTGTFTGGNGRGGVPNPGTWYEFDVPRGAASLSVGFTVNGDTNLQLYGFLIDPNGEPVSEKTNAREDGSTVAGLQFTHVKPQAGRWRVAVAQFGPGAGTALETPFTGRISLDPAAVRVAGVPNSAGAHLKAGTPVTTTVRFTNRGAADQAYFLDGRLAGRTDVPLVVDNADFTIVNAPLGPFPAARVPTETNSFHMAATGDGPFNFEVSPFPADHVEDLAFEGDPDREAGPAGTSPSVTVSDPVVAPQTWLALPTIAGGPFSDAGAGTVTMHFTASAHTRPFDPAVTSATGDPLLAYVSATAPAATPVSVESGASGSIQLTITPTGAAGTVVRGTLFLDAIDPITGSTDEVAAVPYAYTVS